MGGGRSAQPEPAPAAGRRLRWGIMGTGEIAASFAREVQEAGIHVAAVGSRTPAGARAFAERHGIPHGLGSYEALVSSDEVDVVYVATPHVHHLDSARLALDAGKHVLVEKPFTVNAEQAAALIECAERNGRFLLEAMKTRFLPHTERIRQVLAEGTIGEVTAVVADHGRLMPTDPTHRINDPRLGGGSLLDLGVYLVSFVHDLLGAPVTVRAVGHLSPTGVDSHVAMSFVHEGGAIASLFVSQVAAGRNEATILGTKGAIRIDPVWYMPTTFTVVASDGTVVERFDGRAPGRGLMNQTLEAERLILAGKLESDRLPWAESLAVMRVLDEVRHQIGLRYPGEDERPDRPVESPGGGPG